MKILVVVDMQNDFIDMALGTDEAIKIVPNVVSKIKEAKKSGAKVIYTMDTHEKDYLSTQEGKNLPVEHCIKETKGWKINDQIMALVNDDATIIQKPTFGSVKLGEYIASYIKTNDVSEVELVGLCTDICVISNAFIIKAYAPQLPIRVDASCCAGVSIASHENALNAMEVCQIKVDR